MLTSFTSDASSRRPRSASAASGCGSSVRVAHDLASASALANSRGGKPVGSGLGSPTHRSARVAQTAPGSSVHPSTIVRCSRWVREEATAYSSVAPLGPTCEGSALPMTESRPSCTRLALAPLLPFAPSLIASSQVRASSPSNSTSSSLAAGGLDKALAAVALPAPAFLAQREWL
eukprot:CAMPEP_0174709374 /NCGR_PEP_ID=MMETSP1094-20130205/11354_1 /TAXON_ID=156173 /ORGANISM="Chrysochromulina brevifilum, Strain UTEX LB 985" /LENGTH=174 /DNA_ID=CAMNT_0015908045 /DNA_START=581 /DNA_END=1102 /DNA_ORIENTATION=+